MHSCLNQELTDCLLYFYTSVPTFGFSHWLGFCSVFLWLLGYTFSLQCSGFISYERSFSYGSLAWFGSFVSLTVLIEICSLWTENTWFCSHPNTAATVSQQTSCSSRSYNLPILSLVIIFGVLAEKVVLQRCLLEMGFTTLNLIGCKIWTSKECYHFAIMASGIFLVNNAEYTFVWLL